MKFFQVTCDGVWPRPTWVVRAESPDAAVRCVVRSQQDAYRLAEKCPEGTSPEDWRVYEDARAVDHRRILAALWATEVVELTLDDNGILFKDVEHA